MTAFGSQIKRSKFVLKCSQGCPANTLLKSFGGKGPANHVFSAILKRRKSLFASITPRLFRARPRCQDDNHLLGRYGIISPWGVVLRLPRKERNLTPLAPYHSSDRSVDLCNDFGHYATHDTQASCDSCARAHASVRSRYLSREALSSTVDKRDEQIAAHLEGHMLMKFDHEITVAHRDRVHLLL